MEMSGTLTVSGERSAHLNFLSLNKLRKKSVRSHFYSENSH